MAYIYKITNEVNQKCYIGKTHFSIEKRFKEHCNDCFQPRQEKRPLYSAMQKYGIEFFSIELIEETDNPEEREQYWIEYYNGYTEGYNATLGGDSRHYIDYALVIKTYGELQSLIDTATFLGIHEDSVRKILIEAKVPIKTSQEVIQIKYGNRIQMIDKNTLDIIQEFPSQKAAAQFLIENNYSNVTDVKGLAGKISLVARGKRKTCAGYIWRYPDKTEV